MRKTLQQELREIGFIAQPTPYGRMAGHEGEPACSYYLPKTPSSDEEIAILSLWDDGMLVICLYGSDRSRHEVGWNAEVISIEESALRIRRLVQDALSDAFPDAFLWGMTEKLR